MLNAMFRRWCTRQLPSCTGAVTSLSSWSREPISVQQLTVMNEVSSHSQNGGTDDDDDDYERVSVRLSLSTSSVVLHLRRSQMIRDQTPVYVSARGQLVRWVAAPANQVTHSQAKCSTITSIFVFASRHTLTLTHPSHRHQARNYATFWRLGFIARPGDLWPINILSID